MNSDWDYKLQVNKDRLDEILKVGILAQSSALVPITVTNGKNESYTVNALVTTCFEKLCEHASLIIYDNKALNPKSKIIGNTNALNEFNINFSNPEHLKKMLQSFYLDYVIGVGFELPLQSREQADGSEHYCLMLPASRDKFPQIRYMFWDVPTDFKGFTFPKVPLLDELNLKKGSITPFALLAESIALALTEMKYPPDSSFDHAEYEKFLNSTKIAIQNILGGDEEPFLKAIEAFRETVINYYKNKIFTKMDELKKLFKVPVLGTQQFEQFACRVISTQELELIDTALSLTPKKSSNLITALANMAETASKYNVPLTQRFQEIRIDTLFTYVDNRAELENPLEERNEYLRLFVQAIATDDEGLVTKVLSKKPSLDRETIASIKSYLDQSQRSADDHLVVLVKNHIKANLKVKFLNAYQDQLSIDNQKLCGLFGFFSKSLVQPEDSLESLLRHATGQSGKGSGKRSRAVMQSLGWLGKNNQHEGELQHSNWALSA